MSDPTIAANSACLKPSRLRSSASLEPKLIDPLPSIAPRNRFPLNEQSGGRHKPRSAAPLRPLRHLPSELADEPRQLRPHAAGEAQIGAKERARILAEQGGLGPLPGEDVEQ